MNQGRMQPPKRYAPSRFVDLNAADLEQLAKVPGIGPRMAEAIVAQRPLRGWDDVKNLPGVSQGLIKQLRSNGVRIGPVVRHAAES